MDFTEQQAKEEVLMRELLTLFGIVGIFSSLCPQRMFLIAGDSQTSKPPSELGSVDILGTAFVRRGRHGRVDGVF
jgi:hypothetical protein